MKFELTLQGGVIAHTSWEAETRVLALRLGRLVLELTIGVIDREFADDYPMEGEA